MQEYSMSNWTSLQVPVTSGRYRHYSDPNIPKVPGIENFKGLNIHSHSYRKPEAFEGKRVIVFGGGISGSDIALELVNVARKVYLSHWNPEKIFQEDLGFQEVKDVNRYENGKFVLKDGNSIEADAIIFCTGYKFVYPFLDKNTGITVVDNFVSPLYKHVFNVQHPTMSFVGVAMGESPFLMIHVHSQYIAAQLRGKFKLPTKDVMETDVKLKTKKKRKGHNVSDQHRYGDDMASEAGFTPVPSFYWKGYDAWNNLKKTHLGDFRKYNMFVTEDKNRVWLARQS